MSPPSPLEESASARRYRDIPVVIYSFNSLSETGFGPRIVFPIYLFPSFGNFNLCYHLLLEYEDPPVPRTVSTMGIKGMLTCDFLGGK